MKEIKELGKLLGTYNITLPRRPPESVKTPSNTEAFEESFTARLIITMIQEEVSLLLRLVRTTVTNNEPHNTLEKFLFQEIDVES